MLNNKGLLIDRNRRNIKMLVREERIEDYNTVYKVIEQAFKSAEHSDGNEQELVVALRKSDAFLPELSLVAQIDEKIVGHILFTKIQIGNDTELALAPLAVLPEYQKKGVGRALVLEGHRIAKDLGFHYSVVLGSETYYPKMGYVPANNYGIKAPFDVPDENFMAIKLQENSPAIEGTVIYAKEFGELE